MKVIILNGSPHGNKGITSQYTKYLEIKFPKYHFETIEVARKIKKLEFDTDFFNILILINMTKEFFKLIHDLINLY